LILREEIDLKFWTILANEDFTVDSEIMIIPCR
jgi:hypothetical protein